MEETTMAAPALSAQHLRKKLLKLLQFNLRLLLVVVALVAVLRLWWQDRQALEQRLTLLENKARPNYGISWSVDQATGPTDSSPGDRTTAWASYGADDQMEWLELTYDQSVRPHLVEIHENLCPGAVVKVTAFDSSGMEQVIWEGVDPLLAKGQPGKCLLRVSSRFDTNRLRVYLDSVAVPGWNEIDAVGMHYGWWGGIQWASQATASSSFGDILTASSSRRPPPRPTVRLDPETTQLLKNAISVLESHELPPETQAALDRLKLQTKDLLGDSDSMEGEP